MQAAVISSLLESFDDASSPLPSPLTRKGIKKNITLFSEGGGGDGYMAVFCEVGRMYVKEARQSRALIP